MARGTMAGFNLRAKSFKLRVTTGGSDGGSASGNSRTTTRKTLGALMPWRKKRTSVALEEYHDGEVAKADSLNAEALRNAADGTQAEDADGPNRMNFVEFLDKDKGTQINHRHSDLEAIFNAVREDSKESTKSLHIDDDGLEVTAEDIEELKRMVRVINPKFTPARDRIVDEQEKDYVRKKYNPLVKLNASFVKHQSSETFGRGRLCVPSSVVVTGHRGHGGNVGINGIYMKHPCDYQERPVYQKHLEKRPADVPDEEWEFERNQTMLNHPGWAIPGQWFENSLRIRDVVSKERPKLQNIGSRPWVMKPCNDPWFLYYDRGYWRIGPEVARGAQICAKCPGEESMIPNGLYNWEVWDAGSKDWKEAEYMKCIKGGD